MSSFQEAISAQRDQLVTQLKSLKIVVAVLGPGEGHPTFQKRCQIRDELIAPAHGPGADDCDPHGPLHSAPVQSHPRGWLRIYDPPNVSSSRMYTRGNRLLRETRRRSAR